MRLFIAVNLPPEERARLDREGRALRALGFGRVLLDVEGYRRGALNEGLGLVKLEGAGERAARPVAATDGVAGGRGAA